MHIMKGLYEDGIKTKKLKEGAHEVREFWKGQVDLSKVGLKLKHKRHD